MSVREFDLILYGASGYTASYIIKELETTALRIAVAARNVTKIPDTFLPKIECDLSNLTELTSRTKILLNCVGPYTLTGEPVVVACIETHTHYVDICGETLFLDDIFRKYNALAKRNGLRIVQSCGFDSLPADMGTFLLGNMHDIREVDCVHILKDSKINTTTWKSLLLSLRSSLNKKNENSKPEAMENKLKEPESEEITHRRTQIKNQENLNDKTQRVEQSTQIEKKKIPEYRYNVDLQSYDVRFRGTDPYILNRSCEYFRRKEISDVKFSVFMNVGSFFNLFLYLVLGFIYFSLIRFQFFFDLLSKYSGIFTLGLVVDRPDPKITEKGKFSIVIKGKSTKREGKRVLTISGQDPGYRSTAIFIVQSAITLFEELENTTSGVVTPAIAFHRTRIIDRLISRGIKFDYSDE